VIGAHAVVQVAEIGVADAAAGDGDDDFAGSGFGTEIRAGERGVDRRHQPAVGVDAHRREASSEPPRRRPAQAIMGLQ
jgi:hypothetical protein